MSKSKNLRLIVLCPHFEPDMAPTGVVMTRIVHELAARGHELHVVTSLPWYRKHQVETGWAGSLWRVEKTNWGSISRVQPFAGQTKSNLLRRAIGFILFSYFVGVRALFAGRFWRRVDGVLAMSPPLTLGLIGWHTKLFRGGKLVFNIQDVFPDAAVETGAISNQRVIAAASWLERISYQRSDSVVLLSDDLANNVQRKLDQKFHKRIKVIPNFVDTQAIVPTSRLTNYRRELGIDESLVVMYAGNVGFSQSLELMIEAARVLPDVVFVINGEGAARKSLEAKAKTLRNVKFGDYQDASRRVITCLPRPFGWRPVRHAVAGQRPCPAGGRLHRHLRRHGAAFVVDDDDEARTRPPNGVGILVARMQGGDEDVCIRRFLMTTDTDDNHGGQPGGGC